MSNCIKKRKKKNRKAIFILLFFAIFLSLYSFSNKMLIELGYSAYGSMLSTASYYALEKSIDKNTDFETFFKIEKNNQGDVVMILTDSYKFNLLAVKIVDNISYYLNTELSKGVEVPIGVFTGIGLISGFGKKVNMPLITANSVKCDIVSSFTEAGINQTKHSLIINIIPEVYVVTRFKTKRLLDTVSVLIYENIIVGDIPSTYLSGSVISSEKTIK